MITEIKLTEHQEEAIDKFVRENGLTKSIEELDACIQGFRIRICFNNGITASIIRLVCDDLHCSHTNNNDEFELALLVDDEFFYNELTNNDVVLGHLTIDKLLEKLEEIKNYNVKSI